MKKKLIIIFVLLNSIYLNASVDIVNLYRFYGMEAVQEELEKQMQSNQYWNYYLENKDVSNGYYESIDYLMICEKDMKNIELYDTKKQKKLFSSSVFTGKIDGDKKKEGDLKTPIGAYKLTRRLTNVDPFYGPLALTTNYPNIYDKAQGKTGHGIWIHGLPEKEERDDFTKGCIALDNQKIKTLDKKINIKNSMLIISEEKFQKTTKDDIVTILSNIFKWRDAWKKSDLDKYLSFYDQEFKKSNGQNLEKFMLHKERVFSRKEKKTIKFSNINIIPYPNELNKKLFKVVMDEVYKTRSYTFKGKKELYVEIDGGNISILTES
jgi:murein L,D-transpeptidase YafK